jgi:hypothetical protein
MVGILVLNFFKVKTYKKLRFWNLASVFFYRQQLKFRWFELVLPVSSPIIGEFFSGDFAAKKNIDCPKDAELLLDHKMRYFSHQLFDIENPPNWFINPESNDIFPSDRHWSSIDDFSNGDIKLVWEASRFQWLVLATQGYASTKDDFFINLMNYWLSDWSKNNSTNQGVNWKCGQEASIRVINLLISCHILGELKNPQKSLIKMVKEHCKRISKTLHYAIAQDNNHGTSEVSALFIASSWLNFIEESSNESNRWLKRSREGLEERVNYLVMDDGSFSQYSTNYHRLFLDSISMVEFFRTKFYQDKFSKQYESKISLAIDWLWQLTDSSTGNTPNLGANDGAQLLQLSSKDYRDFRPSIQFSSVLFKNCRLYDDKDCDGILNWLNVDLKNTPNKNKNKQSKIFKHGGYASIIGESCKGLFRYPKFKFRPNQADLLHLDIMDNGETIIGDGGSYSYNKGGRWLDYFSGIESHNTIQFDHSEPMPRLGRFLFGEWPKTECWEFKYDEKSTTVSAKYTDYLGRSHMREVSVENRVWTINDQISGFSDCAVLRWRLPKSDWVINGNQVVSNKAKISIQVDKDKIQEINLTEGFESVYYNEILGVDVLEVKINKPCAIETIVTLPNIVN